HLRDHCITFVFFIESTGRSVIKDVRVRVDAKGGSGIAHFTFSVDRPVVCDRLTTSRVEDKQIVGVWRYLNPGDLIALHVLVTGIDDPKNVELSVDAEGAEVFASTLCTK